MNLLPVREPPATPLHRWRDECVCRVAAMAYVWQQDATTREHAVDAIPHAGINGALGDYGQNYKNLAFLAAGLGWDPPTVAFGCGHR